jgi:hypothetical protein
MERGEGRKGETHKMKWIKKVDGFGWFNILFGFALYTGTFYLSYWHTHDLMRRGYYDWKAAHVGTWVGEGIFILGMVNALVLEFKSKKLKWYSPPRLALYVGAFIVLYSNWSSGLGKGSEAIGIGIGIVVIMIVAELVISHSIKQTRTQTTHTGSHTQDEALTQRDNLAYTHANIRTASQQGSEKLKDTQQPHTLTDAKHKNHAPDLTDSHGINAKHTHNDTQHTLTNNSPTQLSNSHSQDKKRHTQRTQKDPEDLTPSNVHSQTHTAKDKPLTQNEGSHSQAQVEYDDYSDYLTITDPHTRAMRIAEEYYARHNKYPSIRKLAKIAGVGEWKARIAKRDIEKKVG